MIWNTASMPDHFHSAWISAILPMVLSSLKDSPYAHIFCGQSSAYLLRPSKQPLEYLYSPGASPTELHLTDPVAGCGRDGEVVLFYLFSRTGGEAGWGLRCWLVSLPVLRLLGCITQWYTSNHTHSPHLSLSLRLTASTKQMNANPSSGERRRKRGGERCRERDFYGQVCVLRGCGSHASSQSFRALYSFTGACVRGQNEKQNRRNSMFESQR